MSLSRYLILFFCSIVFFPILSVGQDSGTLKKVQFLNENQISVENFLSEKSWNELFPNRYGIGLKDTINKNPDFYSFKAFVKAAKAFRGFLSDGSEIIQKRELAAFLSNIAHETSGGWSNAPGGYLKWGMYFLEENHKGNKNNYTDTTGKKFPHVPGKYYYGRGPCQLSWNYNYGQFSEAWFGSKDSLLQHPELLSQDPVLSFASAIWFWMTAQKPKPSCHDIMTGLWQPSDIDIQNGRLSGFGATVNVINGGIECGLGRVPDQTNYRYRYYQYFCDYFKVPAGNNVKCIHQKAFGK